MPRMTAADGIAIHYRDEGEGLPILCLPGLTRDHRDFTYVLPLLQGCRVIRMDYRGRGYSDWAPWQSYTIQQEAQDALGLLDHLGLARAAILGTSRGGLIAMGLAATVPDRLLGVTLNDIGPEIMPEGLATIMGYLGRDPVWKTVEEAVEGRPNVLPGFRNVPRARWQQEVAHHYDATPEGLRIPYDPALRKAVEAAGAQPMPDLWPLFDALSPLPLCVLRGENSNLLSAQTFAAMQARIPGMIAAEVPDRGHVPFMDEPASVDALTRWLKELHHAY